VKLAILVAGLLLATTGLLTFAMPGRLRAARVAYGGNRHRRIHRVARSLTAAGTRDPA